MKADNSIHLFDGIGKRLNIPPSTTLQKESNYVTRHTHCNYLKQIENIKLQHYSTETHILHCGHKVCNPETAVRLLDVLSSDLSCWPRHH